MASDPRSDHDGPRPGGGESGQSPGSGESGQSPGGEGGQSPAPYASLEDALSRAVSAAPWWRRWPAGGRRNRGIFPVVAALGAVLVLSLIGIAAPWNAGTNPARGGGALDPGGPVMASPSPDPRNPQPPPGRSQSGQSGATNEDGTPDGAPCPVPLSVTAAPELAPVVHDLAGSLATGACPQVEVDSQDPARTLAALASGSAPPDVWIPASSLWLRLATSGGGQDLPTSGTSVASSPVVLAVPGPVADDLASQGAWPVWLVFYDQVTKGEIPRMSMADLDTTAGALALVSFAEAAEYHWGDDGDGATFLRMINFRDSLAATDVDPAAMLDRLDGTSRARAATQVGVFPVTEQQLLAHQDRGRATSAVPYGTHEAMGEADYPMAVSRALDDRLAAIADELRAQLRSPAAAQRLVDEGFRPPRGASTRPRALGDTSRFPDYPEPVAVPDAAGWHNLVEGWTWSG